MARRGVHATTGAPSAMNDVEVVTFSLACPSLEQLDEMVAEAVDVLAEVPTHPITHGLHQQVKQCRAALRASRRFGFGPFVLRALSTKVLRLKIDALSFRESRIAQQRASSESMPAAIASWPDVDHTDVALAQVATSLPAEQV